MPPPKHNDSKTGYLEVSLAALIWGSIGVFVRFLNLPVLVIVFYRVAFASLAGLAIISLLKLWSELFLKPFPWRVIVMGGILGFNWLAFFLAIKLTTIANAVILTYTAPLFIALLAPIILKESLEKVTIWALFLSFFGVVLILAPASISLNLRQLSGILWGLASGFTYAVLVILVKPLLKFYQPIFLMFLESFTATFILLPFTFGLQYKLNFFALAVLVIMGILHTAIANILYLEGLRKLKAQIAGVLSYLDPLSASIFAFIFLKETPRLETFIGGVLILLGNYLTARQIYAPRTVA
jgi:drug/metabolite transporter (DMT)-like permease